MLRLFHLIVDGDVHYWLTMTGSTVEDAAHVLEVFEGPPDDHTPPSSWKLRELNEQTAAGVMVHDDDDGNTPLWKAYQAHASEPDAAPAILACSEW